MSLRMQVHLAISLGALLAIGGAATAAEWRVAKLSGSVVIQSGPMRGLALTRGMVLPAGLVLAADRAGRALLVHADDQMIVSPNSTVTVPLDPAGIAGVLQTLGENEMALDRQVKPAADIPFVAAFVKG